MIPCCRPSIGAKEIGAARAVLRGHQLVQGPCVREFEETVATYCGVAYGVAVSSGTTALIVALKAMGVKPHDHVLIPSFTFCATGNAVIACGAEPVLVDIKLETFCIDINSHMETAYDYVLPVHAFGVMAQIRGDCVLEDAACALGSFKGLRGRAATLSFHATKTLTTAGEGGMVLTDDAELATRCRFLRDQKHGAGMAYNYRMTEMQAAVGVEQMKRLDWMLTRRRTIAKIYDIELGKLHGARIPQAFGNGQSYVLLLQPAWDRAKVIAGLAERGVEALPATQFLGDMPHLRTDGLPNARYAGSHAMRIPIWPDMTEGQVEQVIKAVKEVLGA